MNPPTPSSAPLPDPAEGAALAALSTVGAALLNPPSRGLPPVTRAEVTFDGCAGSGQLTGTQLFGADDEPLDSCDAEQLLEVPLPGASDVMMPIGKLLNGALLSLLDILHPSWADEEGCDGRIELYWAPLPDGSTETQVGGNIGYRSIVTHTYEFRSANGALTPREG